MDKKRLLLLFIAAGLILGVTVGVSVYDRNRIPSGDEMTAVLEKFTEKIASGDMNGARGFLTEDSRKLLRDPVTVLGKTVYQNLRLKSAENILPEGDDIFTADVVFSTPDTLKIMMKAGMLFAEKVREEGPADDPDRMLEDIYREILSRDDLPMTDHFCVIRLEWSGGVLRIKADESLQQAVEGNSEANSLAVSHFAAP